jgi:hypothetical protein
MDQNITLIAVGDVIIDREEPASIFKYVANILRSGDITFANCDQVYSNKGYPYISRTHVFRSDPDKTIAALNEVGINVVSLANNHSMDMGPDALLDTVDKLKKSGISAVGVGKNLGEARKPVIIERKGSKIGFLAYGCVGPEKAIATAEQPGYAPVRAWTIYRQVDDQPGSPPQIVTLANRDDLLNMEDDIRKLKSMVDIVAVSFHWGLHFQPVKIPMYEFEVGHTAVDAGADIILGGHAHLLKGIEFYKGKCIFHGLNDFATELTGLPLSSFKKGLLDRVERGYHPYYEPDPEYISDPRQPEARATIIAKILIGNGKIERISCIPCYVNKISDPEKVTRDDARGREVFDYLGKISKANHFSTSFSWLEDEITISQG